MNMTTMEKIETLRSAMRRHKVDGVYIPSSDPHRTEYLPAHWRARAWFSGFTGSAGTLCVTQEQAALWTDGRYFIQAARQLEGSGIQLMRMRQPGVPTVEDWLAGHLPQGGALALDGLCISGAQAEKLQKACGPAGIRLADLDLVTEVWKQDRPPVPATEMWMLPEETAGNSPSQKLAQLRERLAGLGCSGALLSRLDCVAWLTNLRADDVEYTPFAIAYCLVEKEKATLFTDTGRIPAKTAEQCARQGLNLRPYTQVEQALRSLPEGTVLLCDPQETSWKMEQILSEQKGVRIVRENDPVIRMKAVRCQAEMAASHQAHRLDGAAMVRFERELRRRMESGEGWTEGAAARYLLALRRQAPECLGESFETIVAWGPNAAMMHYAPDENGGAALQAKGVFLVDSGGQYTCGTTDITRTYALGPLTQEERRAYTLVLKAHIAMSRAVFPQGRSGSEIDALARVELWRYGLDYRCGTGHGVGFVGVIHEEPQGLSQDNRAVFEPGMMVTVEPGVYQEGEYGVRIENEVLCTAAGQTEYGNFLQFEAETFCPIDTRPLCMEMFTEDERNWLNRYHQQVCRELKDLLAQEEYAWLCDVCKPV